MYDIEKWYISSELIMILTWKSTKSGVLFLGTVLLLMLTLNMMRALISNQPLGSGLCALWWLISITLLVTKITPILPLVWEHVCMLDWLHELDSEKWPILLYHNVRGRHLKKYFDGIHVIKCGISN